MSGERPTREDISPGMTVTVVQGQENNTGEPLVGDVRRIVTDEHSHPEGILVELESGVTGRVTDVGEAAVEE